VSEPIESAQEALCELTQAIGRLDEAEPGTLAVLSPMLMALEGWLYGVRFRTFAKRGQRGRWVLLEYDTREGR
jgi:hypothetical protein